MSLAILTNWARALGGQVSPGSGVICPGPRHSARDRSLSVTPSIAAPDGFVVYSHSGNDFREGRDYVKSRLVLPPSRNAEPRRIDGRPKPATADDPQDGVVRKRNALW